MPYPSISQPFFANLSTSAIAANSTAPTAVQLLGDNTATALTWRQFRLMNNGAQTVYCAYGSNATVANTNAQIPTNATTGAFQSYPVPAGAVEVITAPVGQFWTGITASNFAGASFFITPGVGF
jgi:hypothetical protein